MTRPVHIARGCTHGALTLTVFACYAAWLHYWIALAAFAYGVVILTVGARMEYARHRRARAEARWAERTARGEHLPPLDPCCELWRASGTVHAPACTRAQFEQLLATAYDDDTQNGAA